MAVISAFIGRSFNEEDKPLWQEIATSLDSLKRVGFSWEDAEETQAKSISDKVRERIERNDIFIGILTKRDPICNTHIALGAKHCLLAKIVGYSASYWVIQESGYAMGKGKKVIFLIEDGLDIPASLNADFEYVPLNRDNLLPTSRKLTEIISNEIGTKIGPLVKEESEQEPSEKVTDMLVAQESEIDDEEEASSKLRETLDEVDAAMKNRDYLSADKAFKGVLAQETDEEFKRLLKIAYHQISYYSGRSEAFDLLKGIADENPEDYGAIAALASCLQFYDKHEEAKETVGLYLKQASDRDIQLKLSILLSDINTKRREFEQAKSNLHHFLAGVNSNSDEQNFSIYRTLGNIYKEQGELDISCSIYEMALKYEPTNLALRFTLAYDYNEVEKHALSVYHYKAYLKTRESFDVMNNLGVSYGYLKLLGKSVKLYKRAAEEGNTLANANIAKLYIYGGFYDDARRVLDQAVEKVEHHKDVDHCISELRTSIQREEKQEESVLEGAREQRQFVLDFAQAISVPFDRYHEIDGLWVTDYKRLQTLKIQFTSPDVLEGEHEHEYAASAFIGRKPEKRIKRTSFSGKMINRGFRYSIKVSSYPRDWSLNVARPTREEIPEFGGLGILSEDNQQIRFTVEKQGKSEFFTSKREVPK